MMAAWCSHTANQVARQSLLCLPGCVHLGAGVPVGANDGWAAARAPSLEGGQGLRALIVVTTGAGAQQDMPGQFLQVLLKVAGCPVEVQCPGGELGADVADADLPWWCGAVVLAVDEHAFGQVSAVV